VTLRRSFWATLVARETTQALGFLSTLLLARLLGPGGQGSYALVLNASLLMAIPAALGLSHANTYLAGQTPSLGGSLLLQSLFVPLVTVPLLTLLLTTRGGEMLLGIIPGAHRPLLIAGTFVLTVAQGIGGLLLGLQQVRAYNLVNVLPSAGVLVGNLALWYFRRLTPVASLTVWVGAQAFAALVSTALAGMACKKSTWTPSVALWLRSLKIGGRVLVCAFLGLAMYRSNLLLVDRKFGSAGVGIFSIALVIAEILHHAPAALGILLYARSSATSIHPGQVLRTIRLHLVLSGLLAASMAGLSTWILPWVFGARYDASVAPLQILTIGAYFCGFYVIAQNYLAGKYGYARYILPLNLLGFTSTVGLSLLLIPRWGLQGAAWAMSAAQMLLGLTALAALRRDLGPAMAWGDIRPRASEITDILRHRRSDPAASRVADPPQVP
jgi:O-antigen/teichoic acid export membrane protein